MMEWLQLTSGVIIQVRNIQALEPRAQTVDQDQGTWIVLQHGEGYADQRMPPEIKKVIQRG